MANRFFSYHNTACKLITSYRKEMPLQHFLKQYFSENKKHGSKDRKWISHFCYSFYRLGKSLSNMEVENRLPIAVYLCTEDLDVLGDYLPENWLKTNDLDAKIQYAQSELGFQLDEIFPFTDLLMPEIDIKGLNKSFLRQPDVFLRVRPDGNRERIEQTLLQSNIDFQWLGDNAIRLKSRVAIDEILQVNRDVVVQDLSSQAIASLFPDDNILSIWDCCAASGGKTILAKDRYPKAEITVSDVRTSILHNHKKRMEEAGIKIAQSFVQDLTKPSTGFRKQFDLVICDAPCTGSGTWSRTPEELYFFQEQSLLDVVNLQSQILSRIEMHVKNGGYLLYVTCSLFAREDEEKMQELCSKYSFTFIHKRLIQGFPERSDTMYGCLLRKTNV